jgi:DNA-binding transcriptional LysR family regulator
MHTFCCARSIPMPGVPLPASIQFIERVKRYFVISLIARGDQSTMLDLELLRTFVAVADRGGFRRAAEQLYLTQSTVSQQIKRLEQEAGRPLFARTTRAVALTPDGEVLLGDARRLLRLEEAARQRLTGKRLSGTIRLGAVEEVAGGSLPPALGRFARLHPEVRLEVFISVSRDLIDRLDAGGLDVVLAKRPWGTSRGRVLWREPLVWAAAEAFQLGPEAMLPLALYHEPSISREAALAALRRTERSWYILCTSPSLTGVRAAALAGLAVTPILRGALQPGLRVLGEVDGLPALPDAELVLVEKPEPDQATAALAEALATIRSVQA